MTALEWTLWSIGLLACLSLLGWALFWDRARGRLRCPKCWYDMSGAVERRCSECGHVARRDRDLRRTRRRWKASVMMLVGSAALAAAPFWRPLLRAGAPWLPSTALILLAGPTNEPALVNELRLRIIDSPSEDIWRWDPRALFDWQWRLLADQTSSDSDNLINRLSEVAACFIVPPMETPAAITHEELMSLGPENDPRGLALAQLGRRIGCPIRPLMSRRVRYEVAWQDIEATDGSRARLYRIRDGWGCVLLAVRQSGDSWVFAGAYRLEGDAVGVQFEPRADDETICEISRFVKQFSGERYTRIRSAWFQVDEHGLRLVHKWLVSEQHEYPLGNYMTICDSTELQRDERGRYVDHLLTMQLWNSYMVWDKQSGTDEDRTASLPLVELLRRTGRVRYRWNDHTQQFEHSPAESDWTQAQVENGPYFRSADALFITQNFEALLSLATGDNPAQRAWMRLALGRMSECPQKQRLLLAIERQSGK